MTIIKGDIENRTDLEKLLEAFYKKVFGDDLIRHYFTEVVPLNLKTHMPVIASFGNPFLLDGKAHRKNVIKIHLNAGEKSKVKKEHLDRRVKMFFETIDDLFEGAKASLAKQRADSIATMMNIKSRGKADSTN